MPEQVKGHTPGPWKYTFEHVDPEWAVVTTSGGACIANVNADFRQEANARLIASAPDLLSACESALPAIRWALTHQQGNHMQFDEVAKLLEGVIARARGGGAQ